MRERSTIIQEGPPLLLGDGGLRLRTNNLRRWTSVLNGAQRISTWNDEDDVVLLGYTAPGEDEADIRSATFTTTRDVGPTASAANCSAARMASNPSQPALSDGFYWADNGVYQSELVTQQDFDDGAGAYPPSTFFTGDNNPKPSSFQIVIGLWIDHDNVYYGGNPSRRGVLELGIGGGDVIYLENLSTGARTWRSTSQNELRLDGLDIPKSTNWTGGRDDGDDAGSRQKPIWLQLNASRSDTWRISVRPPGWAKAIPTGGADFNYAPLDTRYYCQVYLIDGCALIPGTLIPSDIFGSHEQPVIDRASRVIRGASDGSVMM